MNEFQKDYLLKRQDYGVLYPYVMEETVTDIHWNGRQLWIDDLEKGRYMAPEVLSESFANRFSMLLSNLSNKAFNRDNPVMEVETEELRICLVHPSVAYSGLSISLKKTPAVRRLKKEDMTGNGYCDARVIEFLIQCMAAHCSIAICGCSGSGKTELLKLSVMGPDGQWVEIQIRSRRMDEIAEKGFAAHWKYKEHNIEEDTELDKWLQTITEILESPDPNALDFLDTIKLNLFTSEIFVFTPKGDIKTLPQGATALDFGYALHSDIGNKCIGAKVNHRLVPLSHQLASGDQVEILTSRSQNPQPEWLNFVTTARARARIDAYLKRIRKEAAKEGEIKVIDAFKRNNLEANTSNIDKLCMYFGFSKREEFYYAVEKGEVILPENIHKLLKEKTDNVLFKYVKQALRVATKATTGKKEEEEQPKEKPKYDKKKPYILKEEAFERNYVIADCCKPIPGDESLGFINDDGNVVVHKRSCPIAMRLKSSFGERILNTEWSSHHSSFEATLEIKGIDSIGVLNTITRTISDDFNVNIIRLLIEAKDGVFEGRVKMKVHDVEDIQRMCVVLSKIKNIQSVARVAD